MSLTNLPLELWPTSQVPKALNTTLTYASNFLVQVSMIWARKENEMAADNGRPREGIVITTYVNYMGECFLITTTNLKGPPSNCSPQYFHKTTASTFDIEGKEIMDTIAVIEDGVAIDNHLAMCEQLYKTGKYISEPAEEE